MRYLATTMLILRKDILEEMKSKEVINSMLIFGMLVVIVFSFIFEPGSSAKDEIMGGVLWMAITFSGILGLNKSMLSEVNGGNLSALLLAPVDRSAIFFGKVLSNFAFMLILEAIIIPIFTVLYNANLFAHGLLPLWVFILATFGFAVLGTLFSVISVKSKTREIMLPLLLLPILVPIILAAIQATNIALRGTDMADAGRWLKLMGIFDIIFTAVSAVLFDFIVED